MPTVKPIYRNDDGTIDRRRSTLSLGLHGKLGHPNEYGFNDLGKSQYGEFNPQAGTYRRGRTGYNNRGYNPERKSERILVQMRDCTPNNPRTVLQQQGRNKFKEAIAAWQALTPLEKATWNATARKKGRYGYHAFITDFLKNAP